MILDDVQRWALAEGMTRDAFRELHDDALLMSISRLMQAVHRERLAGCSELSMDADDRWALAVGRDPSLRLAVTGPLPFLRLEPVGLPRMVEDGRAREVRTAAEFLSCLRLAAQDAGAMDFDRVASDFHNSFANLVLDRVLFDRRRASTRAIEPTFEGHGYYPFPGLRVGPSLAQVVACSNLSPAPVKLSLARARPHVFASVDYDDTPAFYASWSGRDAGDWQPGLLPIHPWQSELSDVVRSGALVRMVDSVPQTLLAVPLASQRTCRIAATGFDVKLPVDATLTGERRLLYGLHVSGAPVVSAFIRAVLEQAGGPPTLSFQHDLASCRHADELMGTHVAAIVRGPLPQIPGETVVPALSLWSSSRLADDLLRIDRGSPDRTIAMFRRYCEVLLEGPLEFYARHGVAFEPHLQNTLVRIDDEGRPVGIVLRDLDATILDAATVPAQMARHGLWLSAAHWDGMPSYADGGRRLAHAILHAHLGQVVAYLTRHACVDADALSEAADLTWTALVGSSAGAERERLAELRGWGMIVKRTLTVRMRRSMVPSFADPAGVA